MVITSASTAISFFPFVTFDDVTTATIQVWHKNTKTKVTATNAVTKVGSKVTINLPSLTAISDVAEDLDTLLIRVYLGDVLKWEYVATYSNESTNINRSFKEWDEVAEVTPQWIQI
jgi:hypothetical protein